MSGAASPTAGDGRGINRGMITVSIMLATIMQVVDMTIVNVALPHMQGAFSAAPDQIAWIVTAFIVAYLIRFHTIIAVTKGVPPLWNYVYVMPLVALLRMLFSAFIAWMSVMPAPASIARMTMPIPPPK